MLFFDYTVKKKMWKSEKDWQTVGCEQDFADDKHVEKGPKNTENAPA